MSGVFQIEDKPKGLKVMRFDRSDLEMNILSAEVLQELDGLLDDLGEEQNCAGLVFISGKPDQFIVGADIKDIESFDTAEQAEQGAAQMQQIFAKIAALPFPTVAAIHGPCLGGGLEMSLAMDWRVVSTAAVTKLALPEIQLGLIPGAGGTQRLPRLVGIQAALDMILTGKRIPARKALKMGLADAAVPPELLEQIALEYALKKNRTASSHGLQRMMLEDNPLGRTVMATKAREMVQQKTKGFYPASDAALTAVFKGYSQSLEQGLKLEAKLFGQVSATSVAASLIHLFHGTTEIKKGHHLKDAQEKFADPVGLVGIIGGGFMGVGIGTLAADRGVRVRVADPSTEALRRGLNHARAYFEKKKKRRRIKSFELEQKMSMISPGIDRVGFEQCDIVIEAVFEDLDLKQKLLRESEEHVADDWVFASNTSAIPIATIAAAAKKPERVLGMHFFSPVEKMPLLEIIATDKTADWAVGRAAQFGKTLGKQVIVVGDGPGFYTTRILAFFLNEAAKILVEGVSIERIDRALVKFGFPVGPITLIDEVGIDVGIHVLETMAEAFSPRIAIPKGFAELGDSGRLGRKNSKGFYLYENDKKTVPDESIYKMFGDRPSRSDLKEQDIVDRCVLLFVNEAIRCLEEQLLRSPFDGDIGAVFGLGFPPFLGGPFHYVDLKGADQIVTRLEDLADRYGPRFDPSPMLRQMSQDQQKFFP